MADSYFQIRYRLHPGRENVWLAICNYLSSFIPADAVVLELGSGYCDFINHVRASKKIAVDINPLSGNYCNKEIEFIQSDVLDINFQPGSIGIVLASNFFEHFNDHEIGIVLDNISTWLTDKGKLILIQPNYKYAWRDYWDDYTHIRAFSHISLSDLLKSKGFNVVRVEKRFLPFSFKSLLPKSYFIKSYRVKQVLFVVAVIFFSFNSVSGQKVIKAIRVETPPVMDGFVNDASWENAFSVTDFTQREPDPGQPVSQKTLFLVCYDSDNLYFGIRCWDEPGKITAKEMARDVSLSNDDRIQIILDTYSDKRNGYWFQIGPRGSIGDAIVSENGAVLNKDWDGLWDGKARISDWGWEAEMVIPFKTLGFDKNKRQWGIKFIRHMVSRLEQAYWPDANINNLRFQVSDAGILDGIENINQGIGLDISPYLLVGLDTEKGRENREKLTGGVDVFYQITPSLKSSLTIHTDFAETEVDDRQINLTRFNLHFPEKRDFFLDGANYFQFGIEGDQESPVAKRIIPFFSRRIGLDTENRPIPVNYGGKLTGQAGKWNTGIMVINDDNESGHHYSVARVSRNIGRQSSAGVIGTFGNAMGAAENFVTGCDLKLSTSTFRGNKNASLFLFGLQSVTDRIRTNNTAWGVQGLYPNDLIYARLGYHEIGRNFQAGIGFVPRNDIREIYGQFRVGPRPQKWGILQFQAGIDFSLISNIGSNLPENREIRLKPLGFRFMSGEEISLSFLNLFERLPHDFGIFSSVVIPRGSYEWWRRLIQFKTKGARKVWGEGSYNSGSFYDGHSRDFNAKINWKIAVPLFLGGGLTVNKVRLPRGNFTAAIYQLNANLLFSPKLTLYNYVQYDNASSNLGCQSRFQWILKPGRELILVWTSGFIRTEGNFSADNSATRMKIKYNIRF